MRIVIFGCGEIGTTIISALQDEGHDIIAIDRDVNTVEEITNIYDVMGLSGNGVDTFTMNEAGVGEADLFVSVTNSDELNMLSCFLARKMGAKHTIARIRNPEYNDDSLSFVRNHLDLSMALNPERIIAHEIFNMLRFPAAVNVETFSGRNLEIIELLLKQDSPFADVTLSELRKKHKEMFLVCDVLRGDRVYIPDGNFKLQVGDRIGITAPHNEMLKLLKNLGLPQRLPRTVVILGASRTSYYLAKMLMGAGVKVKIIDRDREKCVSYSVALPDAVIIQGDGMKQEILLEEGIASTGAYIALTGNDEENILSSYFAKEQKVPTVVTRINRQELVLTAEKLGLECIVSPQKSVSNVLSRYVRALQNSVGSNMETLYKLCDGKVEVLEFKVTGEFEYINIPLRDMKLKQEVLVAGIVRGRKPMIPNGSDVILPNDKVIVLAAGEQLRDLSDIIEK